jgi:hypothetical protein
LKRSHHKFNEYYAKILTLNIDADTFRLGLPNRQNTLGSKQLPSTAIAELQT